MYQILCGMGDVSKTEENVIFIVFVGKQGYPASLIYVYFVKVVSLSFLILPVFMSQWRVRSDNG